ncbi:MAG: tetratricopeptide repeat-containing sensor histidine kinase [Bacteroidales bacterium]|nr:tetratricopeptide repeat-containing sensor histidine kinase [Bacteroidales bacterium]HPD94616.1 tetratricopeptide repeat-containing sensor histidine kinase [Tenuifilaceae bacterium]
MKILSMKVKVFSFLFLLILPCYAWANGDIDSLEAQLSRVDELKKIEILTQLGKAYWSVAPSKGMFYSNEAVKLAEKYHDPNKKAKALLYGGVNAWFMGDYDNAIEYYQKSLTIAREVQNDRLCAYNLNNLGMVNTHLKNYEKAIENYSESSQIIKKIGDEIEYAKVKSNVAELNVLLGNLDKALKQYLSILSIIENSDEQIFLIWLYNDIGTVYKKKGDYESALQYFYKALNLSNRIDNNLGRSKTMNHIGEVYLLQKENEKAKEFFYDGLKYAKQTNAKEDINETYKNISEYYSSIDSYKKSLDYYKLHKQLSDSIVNDNKIRTIIEMQARYELESTEKENSLLRKNIEISKLTIKKNKALHIFLIILLLLTISLAVLIHSRLMIRKRKNEELSEKNTLISEQKDQLANALIELKELNKILRQQKDEIQVSKKELEEVNQKLTETNATKDKFFSIIAHDLRSPFNALLGFSEMLDEEFDSYGTEEKKKLINYIHLGVQNTFNLLENLLQWAKSQRGTISFEPVKIDLRLLATATCKLLNQQAEDKSIKLVNHIPENMYIQADYNMISTVIRNLVSNAIKFTPKGGEVRIEAELTADNDFVRIAVKDNGGGISEDTQSKLFSITGNVSTLGTENEIGTGLGLILCKEFVEKHNGKIWVESEVGKGSSFYFTIPHK